MSVAIRLQRVGKTNQPQYRIVVIENKKRTKGEPLAIVGHYDPTKHKIELEPEEYDKWINNGAQPSDTVKSLYKKFSKKQKIQSEIITAISSNV